jgi:septal ring factor EnvC (AmiA/AmiB activator)
MTATHDPRDRRPRLAQLLLCALMCVGPIAPGSAGGEPTKQQQVATRHQATRKPTKKAAANASGAAVASPVSSGDPMQEQARQSAERDRLTVRIAELRRQIADGEKSRSGAAAALARAERALADVNRRLDELAQRQKAAQDLVAALDRQRVGTEGQIAVGRSVIARTMTMMAANRDQEPVRTWLGGGDPSATVLTDGYLEYAARAQGADLEALQTRVSELQERRQRADDDNRTLAQQADAQKTAREALASTRLAQRQALERLSQQLAEQRSTASALEADEKRLSRVVEQLQKLIEQKANEERARRQAAAKRQAEQEAAARKKGTASTRRNEAPPPRVEPEPDEAAGGGAFAQLRGQLRLPVRGTVTGHYGAARGNSGATWKGLFVKADAGADVRAVAAGKVIYADDLRGFGNLLIVDHGNQYLSIYANNDVLLKRAGDAVQAGDVVSRAGNSSGDDQTGLYFELRFRGRPFDPMPWISGR